MVKSMRWLVVAVEIGCGEKSRLRKFGEDSFDSATRWTANARATSAEKNINIRSRVDSKKV